MILYLFAKLKRQYLLSSVHLLIPLFPFQIVMDPFEEIGMAEKNAEQHRRSASEKEVQACFPRWRLVWHGSEKSNSQTLLQAYK